MNTLSSAEEKRLLGAVESVIRMADAGQKPNDALEKVASEGKFTPPFIHRIAEAFNVVRTSRNLKEASAEKRTASYELANPDEVVRRIYPAEEKEAALSLQLPVLHKPELPALQKVASSLSKAAWFTGASHQTVMRTIDKYREAHQLLDRKLALKEASMKETMDGQLEKLAYEVRRLPKTGLQKMAQLIVNGFPATGQVFLQLLEDRSGVKLPKVEKTAEAAVFPSRDPYFLIADVHGTASKFLKAHRDRAAFSKYAEGLVGDLAQVVSNVATDGLGGLKADGSKAEANRERILGEELDPQFYNNLKEVGTRKTFMDLALYDPDLKEYDMPTLLGAFNSAVSSVPESSDNPGVLKTLMLQRINTGGIQDTYQAAQEAALGKSIRERQVSARAETKTQPRMPEAPSIKRKEPGEPSPLGGLLKGLSKATTELVKPAGDGDEDREKKLADLVKEYGGNLQEDEAGKAKAKFAEDFAKNTMKGLDSPEYDAFVSKNEDVGKVLSGKAKADIFQSVARVNQGMGTDEDKAIAEAVALVKQRIGRKSRGPKNTP